MKNEFTLEIIIFITRKFIKVDLIKMNTKILNFFLKICGDILVLGLHICLGYA